ncbi:hypothetical protein EHQ51_21510 [Pantoea ananatis]|nr:hypothetical protein EHQ51_22960 [Pantoea ananatis]RQN01706.1 hypothetical protein EHQ51_21510 [Pantoea ananatis]
MNLYIEFKGFFNSYWASERVSCPRRRFLRAIKLLADYIVQGHYLQTGNEKHYPLCGLLGPSAFMFPALMSLQDQYVRE